MKIKVEVDCTPQEARQFFGLPEVEDLQTAVLAAAKEKIVQNMADLDVTQLTKMWFPSGMQGFEKWQDLFRQMGKTSD